MVTIRKACRNCTASKRKCVIRDPKCARCALKNLDCQYDLDHLNAPKEKLDDHPNFTFNPIATPSIGYCVLKTCKSRGSRMAPEICRPGNEDSMELVRLGYRAIPELLRAGKPAVFAHPKLRQSLHELYPVFNQHDYRMDYEDLKSLVQTDFESLSLEKALASLQALIIYLATFLFSPQPNEQEGAERCLNALSDWTGALFSSAQNRMTRKQSPWQEWLLGESIRRTIFMSYALYMIIKSFKYGHCSLWLFVESLPFDRRAGLWMALSAQAFIATAGVNNSEEVGEELESYHEFSENFTGSYNQFRGDMFLILAAASHKGNPFKG